MQNSTQIILETIFNAIFALAPLIIVIFIAKKFKNNLNLQNISSLEDLKNLKKETNFASWISPEAKNPEAIKKELELFKTIKNKSQIDPNTLDVLALHKDGSEHRYRLRIIGSLISFHITEMNRYS